jgi:hypothetical protein
LRGISGGHVHQSQHRLTESDMLIGRGILEKNRSARTDIIGS